jgi:hypothetical protein
MSGKVIASPERQHACSPGWTSRYAAEKDALGFGPGWYGIPPSAYNYPKGTAWRCECGVVWVSQGALAPMLNSPGFCNWRREHWWERRRRKSP